MKINPTIFLLPLMVYTLGCSEPKEKTTAGSDKEELSVPAEAGTATSQPDTTLPEAEPLPTETGTIQPSAPAAPAEANKTAVVLNPPHGQPGHDCAIPVGEPLNPQAGKTTAPSAVQPSGPMQLNTSPMQINPPQITAAPKLNPAHGLPGHDCAIPVGAPLN